MQPRLLLLCLLVAAVSARQASLSEPTPYLIKKSMKWQPRQIFGLGDSSTDGNGSSDGSTEEDNSTVAAGSSGGSTANDGSPSTTTAAAGAPTTSTASSSSSTTPTTTSAAAATTPTTSSSTSDRNRSTSYQSTFTASNTAVLSSSINAAGSTVIITQTLAASTSTSAAAASATSSSSSDSTSSGSHTGLIIGVSVVGGVALIGALIFLYMKFGGKRFSDYQDEDADIKWPELKAEGDAAALQPLPARRTGGAGFDMGNEFDDGQEGDAHSMAEYGNKGADSMMGSTTALNTGVGAGANAYNTGTYGAGMEGTYHDEAAPAAGDHYMQNGVSAYYDPYSGYPTAQSQGFYPEQMHDRNVTPSNQQYDNQQYDNQQYDNQQYDHYQDYHNQADPYAAARAQASSVSPQMQPYRVGGGQNMHQGF